ncbi:hypothetical protein T4B_10720 [Trichinella pseudospiralis]|uniref:Uncharacterized protein n=1 Tax=Trichinella pseudospiralis TaxID=6337 RepID=A0A0V1IBU0_TRIPS|nr:hypothetical protein T4B_10720 [Trichinella pseudospiralis]
MELYPWSDGIKRSALVKIATGTLVRTIRKLQLNEPATVCMMEYPHWLEAVIPKLPPWGWWKASREQRKTKLHVGALEDTDSNI